MTTKEKENLKETLQEGNADKNIVSFRELINFPSTTYGAFGIYRYPAKFIPHVVAYILENYGIKGMKVFDPFAGCGTTGLVARIYGYDYELWDLNPMLKILHSIAVMSPIKVDFRDIINDLTTNKKEFIPKWSRIDYWFAPEFLPFLYQVWGYYHFTIKDNNLKLLLTVPLLKVTRYFSYDDQQRQKLSRSPKSKERIDGLLKQDWKKVFFTMLEKEFTKTLEKLEEYQTLSPKNVHGSIKAGVDVLKEQLEEEKDILITSPPYLQSQEYIRQSKMDLFWLGYSEEDVKNLSKLEIPYRNISADMTIYSDTFLQYRASINDEHIKRVFDNYFKSVLTAFSSLQKNITTYLFIFVGHASMRGKGIPIDKVFIEHLSTMGWEHEKTLTDTIVSRRLFSYKVNPATGLVDTRTQIENLVILKRKTV